MATLCIWCGTEHEAGVEGFCSEDCRRDFNTACRIWAAAEYEAERVSIFELRTALYQRARSLGRDPASASPSAPPDTEPSPASPQGRPTSTEVNHGCLS